MKRLSVFLLFTTVVFLTSCSGYRSCKGVDLSAWDKKVLRKANTARFAFYMSHRDKQVIFYTNLCRIDPQLFLSTVTRQYLDSNFKHQDNPYASSLIVWLKRMKPRNVLRPGIRLAYIAARWSGKSGRSGAEGHGDYDKRIKIVLPGNVYAGENCDYGSKDPLTIVMDLLIDEGNPDFGHRENILMTSFRRIGVAIHRHSKDGWTCVMDFKGKQN